MTQGPSGNPGFDELRRKLRETAERLASSRIAPNKSFLHAKQRSLENWICIELALELREAFDEKQIHLEVPYPAPSKGRCDLRVEAEGLSLWGEVAHIWSWTQAKWDAKCRNDVHRGDVFISDKSHQAGVLLLLLFSRPSWYQGEFEGWVHQSQNEGRIILVDLSRV